MIGVDIHRRLRQGTQAYSHFEPYFKQPTTEGKVLSQLQAIIMEQLPLQVLYHEGRRS